MSMVNISTFNQQFPLDDPSEPEAPSYDPPHYEGIFTDSARSSIEAGAGSTSSGEIVSAPIATTSSPLTEEPASTPVSAPLATTTTTTDEDAASPVSEPISAPIPTPSPSNSTDDGKLFNLSFFFGGVGLMLRDGLF